MKKIYTLVLLLALFTFCLELLNIHLSGKLASDSVNVRALQDRIASLNEKNQILNTKVLDLTSFEIIASKAGSLGFVSTHSYISLKNKVKLSYK